MSKKSGFSVELNMIAEGDMTEHEKRVLKEVGNILDRIMVVMIEERLSVKENDFVQRTEEIS